MQADISHMETEHVSRRKEMAERGVQSQRLLLFFKFLFDKKRWNNFSRKAEDEILFGSQVQLGGY